MESQNTEIDIIELLVKIVKFTKQYFIFFIIFTIVGIILGFVISKKQVFYTSEMIATTDLYTDNYSEKQKKIISKKATQIIIETINFLNETNITKELSFKSKISSINASIINNEKKEPTENFKIQVVLSEETDLKTLDKKINSYLSDNNYIKSEFEKNRFQNNALIEKINSEVLEIDSLQNLLLNKKNTNNQIVIESNNVIASLLEKKIDLEKELILLKSKKLEEPLVAITNFYPLKEDISDNKIRIIIITILFLILGVIVALIRELLKISKDA